MRRLLISITAVAAVVACAKTETPPVDTTAMAPAPVAVVVLTDADVDGTWKGTSMPMGSDSVVAHWTQVCAAGKCTGSTTESKTTTHSTYTLAGDSVVGVSEPFSDPAIKGGKIIDTWVVHFSGDNATGTGAQKLASKPDSVVMTYRFTGSRVR